MRVILTTAVLAAIALGAVSCSESGTPSSPTDPTYPATPTGPAAPPPDTVTIDIVGIKDALSFSPNPATLRETQFVVWHNTDAVTHRVVFDDGELDTGAIAPGGFSVAMPLVAPGKYHCSIHPPMVGAITWTPA